MSPSQILDQCNDAELTAIAKAKNPRVKRWCSYTQGSSKRVYWCNICDCTIDTESSQWPVTKHAQDELREHLQQHQK